ncbi:hypothetical protein GOP47_0007716 [Adiantum capillus-veneris]|uniref:Uncharacterized protein n=1 Tax=Adiantum capillus-veneris TaxID=13818 RepID=A0A9D4V2R0_ADICA|nr:hypothetical protein GOP47_0007716 [Adiantum capillus-veneris]
MVMKRRRPQWERHGVLDGEGAGSTGLGDFVTATGACLGVFTTEGAWLGALRKEGACLRAFTAEGAWIKAEVAMAVDGGGLLCEVRAASTSPRVN